jgi:hypothetical protein
MPVQLTLHMLLLLLLLSDVPLLWEEAPVTWHVTISACASSTDSLLLLLPCCAAARLDPGGYRDSQNGHPDVGEPSFHRADLGPGTF